MNFCDDVRHTHNNIHVQIHNNDVIITIMIFLATYVCEACHI